MNNKPIKLSHSKVQLYKECPKKYWFTYIEKYSVNAIPSPLLFGRAFDYAVNYILTQHKEKKPVSSSRAKHLFFNEMNSWDRKVELSYFKGELPDFFFTPSAKGLEVLAWHNLCDIGEMMIDTYINDILPQFKEVKDVQFREVITNEAQDSFTFVLDCVVELQDGRIVLLDNKTASRPYPKNSVLKSDQLAIYNEFYPVEYCGYVVLHKKLKNGKITWQLLVDKIPEEKKSQAFSDIEDTLQKIKEEKFYKNRKSCFAYGKKCGFYAACHQDDFTGLIKK